MIPSATQGNASQITPSLTVQGPPVSTPAGMGSSVEPQKPPEQSSGQSGSETARQTLCGKIAAFFKRIWEFIFGTDGESDTKNVDETPPPAPADSTKLSDEKKPMRRCLTLEPPEKVDRKKGEPLKLYNFRPYADANVCWLNSLTQILFADKDLLNAALEAFRTDGHKELADHFQELYDSKNAFARVDSDLLFAALRGTSAEAKVKPGAQNDPEEAFTALTGRGSSFFLVLRIMGQLNDLAGNGKLQQNGHVTHEQLNEIIKRALSKERQSSDNEQIQHIIKNGEWPPAHLLLHLGRAFQPRTRLVMAFKIPALNSEESAEDMRTSINETIKLLKADTNFPDFKENIGLLESLLQEGNSLESLYPQLQKISTLGKKLSDYDTNEHIKRTSNLLKEVLCCTYTKAELKTLTDQIITLRNLGKDRKEQPDSDNFFYNQLYEALEQLVHPIPKFGEFRQAITVEQEENDQNQEDKVLLLSLLHTQFHHPTHPDRKTSDRPEVCESIAGPNPVWNRVRELLKSKQLTSLNQEQQEALDGVNKFVNTPLCRSLSCTRQNVPRRPPLYLPSETGYNINGVEYELKGVVKHSNSSGERGHYTALVPGFYCDDDKIESINESRFQQLAASGGDVTLHLKKKKKSE